MPEVQDTADAHDETSERSDDARAKAAEESVKEQEYVPRENLDFDPDDGLYTGTAVEGGTKIPGPHDQVDDVEPGDEDTEEVADE